MKNFLKTFSPETLKNLFSKNPENFGGKKLILKSAIGFAVVIFLTIAVGCQKGPTIEEKMKIFLDENLTTIVAAETISPAELKEEFQKIANIVFDFLENEKINPLVKAAIISDLEEGDSKKLNLNGQDCKIKLSEDEDCFSIWRNGWTAVFSTDKKEEPKISKGIFSPGKDFVMNFKISIDENNCFDFSGEASTYSTMSEAKQITKNSEKCFEK